MSGAWLLPDWPAPPGVRALSTLRHGAGVSPAPWDHFNLGHGATGDEAARVEHNRRILRETAGLPSEPRWLRQVHGVGVRRFEAGDRQADTLGAIEADAAVTCDAGVVLAILSADCLPVLFCAEDSSEVAAAHAGWRGLAAGVLDATLAAMRSPADRILVWLGPGAGPVAYEVGDEVRTAFVETDVASSGAFVASRPGHWRVDLYALARHRLRRAGVERVYGGGYCTISAADKFFSHRRDGRSGRMATLVWRQG